MKTLKIIRNVYEYGVESGATFTSWCKSGDRYWVPDDTSPHRMAFYPDEIELVGCTHDFPNTGLLKSWCSKCDVEGVFEWTTNAYISA